MSIKKKTKRQRWFSHVRGSYLPRDLQGWLTYIPFVGYLVISVVIANNLSASYIVKSYLIVVQWLLAGILLTNIAKNKS
jgi:hypothetical protein